MFVAVLFFIACLVTALAPVYLWKHEEIRIWWEAKRAVKWTTFYYKSKDWEHIHLVPLDHHQHICDEDGDCMCHTNKVQYEKTLVYRHNKLGV